MDFSFETAPTTILASVLQRLHPASIGRAMAWAEALRANDSGQYRPQSRPGCQRNEFHSAIGSFEKKSQWSREVSPSKPGGRWSTWWGCNQVGWPKEHCSNEDSIWCLDGPSEIRTWQSTCTNTLEQDRYGQQTPWSQKHGESIEQVAEDRAVGGRRRLAEQELNWRGHPKAGWKQEDQCCQSNQYQWSAKQDWRWTDQSRRRFQNKSKPDKRCSWRRGLEPERSGQQVSRWKWIVR